MRSSGAGLAGLVLLVLLLVFGPVLQEPAGRLIGQESLDAHGTQWFFWFVTQVTGASQGLLFHPWGKDLFNHTGANLLDAALAVPLRWSLGPVLGFNLWIALVLLGNGWGAERLARALGAGWPGRMLAVVAGMLCPTALLEIQQGRPTQAMLLFCGLYLAHVVRPASRRGAIAGGIWLALCGLGYWYYGLLCGLLGLLAHGVRLVGQPGSRRMELERMAISFSVCLVATSPLVLPMLLGLERGEIPGLLAVEHWDWMTGGLRLETVEGKPQGIFILSLLGDTGALRPGAEGLEFVAGPGGLSLLDLAAIPGALWLARGRATWVLLSCLLLLLCAWGPTLVAGEPLGVNPVYALSAEHSQILRRWWWPGRALGPLSILLVGVLGAILPEPGHWKSRGALSLLLVASAGIPWSRNLLPLDSWSAAVSPGIDCLAEAPEGAVIELPLSLGQRPLYHQTLHGKPMLNGMLITQHAFQPAELETLLKENSYVRVLTALSWERPLSTVRGEEGRGEIHFEIEDREALTDLGYRYLIFRKEGFQRVELVEGKAIKSSAWDRAHRVNQSVLGDPFHEDSELAIYAIEPLDWACP